jgi:hypothetical protein
MRHDRHAQYGLISLQYSFSGFSVTCSSRLHGSSICRCLGWHTVAEFGVDAPRTYIYFGYRSPDGFFFELRSIVDLNIPNAVDVRPSDTGVWRHRCMVLKGTEGGRRSVEATFMSLYQQGELVATVRGTGDFTGPNSQTSSARTRTDTDTGARCDVQQSENAPFTGTRCRLCCPAVVLSRRLSQIFAAASSPVPLVYNTMNSGEATQAHDSTRLSGIERVMSDTCDAIDAPQQIRCLPDFLLCPLLSSLVFSFGVLCADSGCALC